MDNNLREKSLSGINGNSCDVLLIPPVINQVSPVDKDGFIPLGLLTLYAGLREKGYRPVVYVPRKRLTNRDDFQQLAKEIVFRNPRLIGFSTWCISYPASLLIAREVKLLKPEIPIVFGGPQASIVAEETLRLFDQVDFVLSGEADNTLPSLVRMVLKGELEGERLSIPGLHYRKIDGSIGRTIAGSIIVELDTLPVPAYDLVRKADSLKLDVGRGCPFSCTYCTTNGFFSGKYRTKSVRRILDEMLLACNDYHIRRFSFAHDLFTFDQSFVSRLCAEMKELKEREGKKFIWTCSARIDCVTEELLGLMSSAGCQSIFFGIESGSEKIQRVIKKRVPISKAYKWADVCLQQGIRMHASYIMGFPEESKEDIELTLRSVLKLAARGAVPQMSELSILPGTPLFNLHKSKLRYDGRPSNFSGTWCSQEERKLISDYPHIFSSFYYLPVRSADRSTTFLLSKFVNHLRFFRNSAFLLGDLLWEEDMRGKILPFFEAKAASFVEHLNEGYPYQTFLVTLMQRWIEEKRGSFVQPYLADVFAFESARSMLIARYKRWQAVRDEAGMFLSPAWTVIQVQYRLESVLPSVNGWKRNRPGVRKGVYFYFLAATSEKECKHYRISEREKGMLEKLTTVPADHQMAFRFRSLCDECDLTAFGRRVMRSGIFHTLTKNGK